MEREIFQDPAGTWWEIVREELDPNGEPVIIPYEEE